MLIPILLTLAVIILVLIGVVALRPSSFCVTRSTAISAKPPAVFPHVNDLHKWEAWSPWEKVDPALKKTFEGPSAGIGASYSWTGNNQVGEGRMTITESRPSYLIQMKLEFLRPFQATNTAEFTFKPESNQTVVTWSMSGKNNFMGKAFGLFVDCDKMIGSQFEEGLAQMKSVVEASSALTR